VTLLVKQPAEKFTVAIEFSGKLPSGATIASGSVVAAAMSEPASSTTLAAAAAADATTLLLTANVLGGARLTVNPNGANQEVVHVLSISGAGPYTATLLGPLMKAHTTGEAVSYQPGASADVLTSTTATISGTQARATVKKGIHGQHYQLTFFVVLSNGDNLEEDLPMRIVQT